MGYANSIPYQQVILNSPVTLNPITVTTVATTYPIGSFTLPTFTFPLSHAYIDVHVKGVRDTSGAENYLAGAGDTTIHDGGATDRKIGACNTGDLIAPASVYNPVDYVIPGYVDVAQYLSSGMTVEGYFYQIDSHADTLILYGCYMEIRLYFGM